MRNITRRRALVAIPAAAAVTALPALAGASDPDAGLLAAIADLDACIATHESVGAATYDAHARTTAELEKAGGDMPGPLWEIAAEKTGYSALYREWNRLNSVCLAASARVFDIPAQTARGVRGKFRVFDDLMVGDEPEGVYWQRKEGQWAASIKRDLDRMVTS